MERGLDVPEQSQGGAAEGAQPGPVDPGAADAPVEAAAPEQTEGAAPDAEAAADVDTAVPGDTDAAQADAAGVVAGADAEPAAEDPVEASVPADPVVPAPRADDEPVPVSGPSRKRTLTGNVVSDKGDRTIVVSIGRRKKHRLYKKYITLTKKLKAHDPNNECQVGDLVRVVESRPLSREKRWRLVEIVKRAG